MDIMKPGDFRQALPLRRRHLFHGMSLIWLLLLPCLASGQNSGQEVETLNKQVETLAQQGKYFEALPVARKAADLVKKVKGEASSEYATSLNTLAELNYYLDRYGESEPLFNQVITIRKKVLGENHPDYAESLNNLAALYDDMGRYGEAEPLYKRAQGILKKALGEYAQGYATSLNNLAALYEHMGRYDDAEPLYKHAIMIGGKGAGKDYPDYASSLNNLGLLYFYTGRYGEAEPLLKEALAIRGRVLSEKHPGYAQSLNNLGLLYEQMGRYGDAEPLYKRALQIRKNAKDENDPAYATDLNNLAWLYFKMQRFSEAGQLFRQALRVEKDVVGGNHPTYALSLNNLAVLFEAIGNYVDAERLFKQALSIDKIALGTYHSDYAIDLNNLARLYEITGRYDDAEPMYIQALTIYKAAFGEYHPNYIESLSNLAELYALTRRSVLALTTFREALDIEQINLHRVFSFSAEPAMANYVSSLPSLLDALLTLASRANLINTSVSPLIPSAALVPADALGVALSWVLRRKGLVLDTMCRFQSSRLLTEANPAYASTSATYRLRRQQRANLALQLNQSPPTQQNALQHRLLDLDKEIDTLEGSLNRTLSDRQGDQTENEPTIEAVRARLPVGSALVEYVWFTPVNFGSRSLPQSGSTVKTGSKAKLPVPAGKPSPATSRAAMLAPLSAKASRYIAFVLSSVPGIPVRLIDLGDASSVDTAVLAMRRSLEQNDPLGGEKRAYGQFTDASHTLYKRIFAPLESALGSTSRLLIAPDGELNRVPFDALLDGQNRYVLKTRQLSYLTCGRDLLRPTYTVGQGAVVFAAPNFDLGVLQRQARARQLLPGLVRTSTLSPAAGGVFAPLPRDARTDGSVIGATLQQGGFGKVQVYVGDDALEEVFKAVSAPLILHVLTHGFYQPDVQRSQREEHLAVARVQGLANPLLRCGIVLAGANARPKATDASADVDDGWVTAEEMGQMNLRGTELVVLSSCESGLGDIQAGEGVFGVRRALMYAGAHSLVTSLFEVPTQPTRTIMKSFYSELAHRQSRQEALHNAQVQQLNADTARGAMIRPRSWAGFILIGEPGKMPIVNKDNRVTPVGG